MPAASMPPYADSNRGEAFRFVLKVSRKLVRGDSDNFSGRVLWQRSEQTRYAGLAFAEPREHLVVLSHAEPRGGRVASPGCLARRPRDAAQHVGQLCDFSISFHASPRFTSLSKKFQLFA
jgi:hypothetical protein